MRYLTLISIIVFLSGCQSAYKITYNSKPQGAVVICNEKPYGYTPIQLEYDLQNKNKQEKLGFLKTKPCTAQWASGAQTDYGDIIDIKKYPNGVIQTVQRPLISTSMINYDKDIEFEKQIQKEREGKEFYNGIFQLLSAFGQYNAINQRNQAIGQHIQSNPSLYLGR